MQWSLNSAKKGNTAQIRTGLLITLLLGFGFMFTQYLAWADLYQNGIVLTILKRISITYHQAKKPLPKQVE